uniref:Uncharacterized protein n=2 Tax=Schistosoma mansoni TaxID=6183 RepID=A0A3Q0KU14_SCHMA
MVCLVWFHVAALLLLLHTSTQTDVELKNPEDVKKEISLVRKWIDAVKEMFATRVSDIQSMRDTIVRSHPNGMKNIDEYIECKSKYFKAYRSNETWSTIQDLRGNYEKQFPDVNFNSSMLEEHFKENAELSENVMSQYSIENCDRLIPYQTIDVRLMDENINEKFEIGKEIDINLIKHEFLSKILKAINNVKTK